MRRDMCNNLPHQVGAENKPPTPTTVQAVPSNKVYLSRRRLWLIQAWQRDKQTLFVSLHMPLYRVCIEGSGFDIEGVNGARMRGFIVAR